MSPVWREGDGPMPYRPGHLEAAEAATEIGAEPEDDGRDYYLSLSAQVVLGICALSFVAAVGLLAVML